MNSDQLLHSVTYIIGAIAALGTAAAGLVDATKLFPVWVNVSHRGRATLNAALAPFSSALVAVLGPTWLDSIMGHWVNGDETKDEQKNNAKALIRLGLSSKNATVIAAAAHVDPDALDSAIKKLETGQDLQTADINVLGRLDATVDAMLDAAYESAEQQYRNTAKFLSGCAAVLLAVSANAIVNGGDWFHNMGLAILVGIVAVPLAPMAKDLTSALQGAVKAIGSVGGGKAS
jgi:hypothetical protein